MKKLFFLGVWLVVFSSWSFLAQAQEKFPPLDVSPMDMSYYPPNYPATKLRADPGPLVARIIYSRPQKKGRVIFGQLEPFGKVDRLGANEADEIDFFAPVKIAGHMIKPGRYTLYAI
ncbi:MAG: DUF2911 domain-containing protein, partial [Chitinophagaceae bacterium]